MEDKFINRELSWIEFNARVLHQAMDKSVPLLERVQFLSIVSSNFDEFFQVRVASIKRMAEDKATDASGLTPPVLLKQISSRTHQVLRAQHECLMDDIVPALKAKGLVYVRPDQYTGAQEEAARDVFTSVVFPLLTPLRMDGEETSFIKSLTSHAAFLLTPIAGAEENKDGGDGKKNARIALVPIPSGLQRIVWLPSEGKRGERQFALLDDIIAMFGTALFPGYEVVEQLFFRIARDADFAVDEDAGENFIHAMENVLEARKSSAPVFMECSGGGGMILATLMEYLALSEDDVYCVDGIMEAKSLLELRGTDGAEVMSFPQWQHFWPRALPQASPFWDAIRSGDVLLNVPYMSYDPVVKFVSDAADDRDVLSIKMTLYRTGADSPIVAALEKAAERGKQVVALVELKARFDEERNIAWAQELERSGVIVVYGLVNLKVHAKALMVMRREGDTIRRYVHLSTGNYNPKTARLYSDLSLFTANEEIATDATMFFNLVTGYSTLQTMKHLSMAPVTMKARIISMIDREAERARSGDGALIMAKMNSLTHEEVIAALYRASRAGVRIMLNVRGICMLVPGMEGMSENITVTSIVDRYLEHSRIFYFRNGGADELYCASADWMPRNLDRRIELMFPILDGTVFKEVKKVLETYFDDNANSHTLQSNGQWLPNASEGTGARCRAQEVLYRRYKKAADKARNKDSTDFTVRRK